MKRINYIFTPFVIFALLVLFSCKKDELKVHRLEFAETIVRGTTSARITADYSYPTKLERVECFVSRNADMSDQTITSAEVGNSCIVLKFKGLQANTKYYYQYEYSNGVDKSKTVVKGFTTNDYGLPMVETKEVADVTAVSAACGGDIFDDGGYDVTARGVCWSTTPNPTINDAHTTDGTGIDGFVSDVSNLTMSSIYYIRAYATNSKGTAYGEQKTFKTLFKASTPGAISSLFSLGNGQQMCFAKGNLQYQASTNTWRFAENQWDYLGTDNTNISAGYSGWIDLFCWATSGYNHGAVCYQPYAVSPDYYDYYAYGNSSYNLYDQTGKADWGYNRISNGGNAVNLWRTPTNNEWKYVFESRHTSSGIRYAKAKVNEINGVILFPDDWDDSVYTLNTPDNADVPYDTNTITASEWNIIENSGAVFLPAAGYRWGDPGNLVSLVGWEGHYWSSSKMSLYQSDAYRLIFFQGSNGMQTSLKSDISYGYSVRLVCPAWN